MGTGHDNMTSPDYAAGNYTVTITGSMATYFGFDNNHQVTALKFFDCAILEYLKCGSNNSLTSLDVNGCTALRELHCENNKLINLDASGCTALRILGCWRNDLTGLDVSDCTALEALMSNDNQLIELDLSKNTSLNGLDCYNNHLISLNLNNNPLLEVLTCDNNQLHTLVLNSIGLVFLFCKGNHLPLSVLYYTSKDIKVINFKELGTQYLLPQSIAIGDIYGEGENEFVTGIYTTYSNRER